MIYFFSKLAISCAIEEIFPLLAKVTNFQFYRNLLKRKITSQKSWIHFITLPLQLFPIAYLKLYIDLFYFDNFIQEEEIKEEIFPFEWEGC